MAAAATAPEPRRWAHAPAPPVTSPLLLFAQVLPSRAPRFTAAAAPAAQPRAPHRLTHEQRWALDRLRLLGATLSTGFTAEELRREYRRLARRYHPDRQRDGSAVDRAAAARCFVEATEAYRRLSTVSCA